MSYSSIDSYIIPYQKNSSITLSLLIRSSHKKLQNLEITCFTLGKRVIEPARRFQNAMVQNPIYEGPLYETLDTQLSNVNHALSAATKSISPDHTTNTVSMEIVNSSPTLRYVEQPYLPQNISPMEGHSTSAQCHTLKQGNGLVLELTVPTSTHGYGEQVLNNDTD